MNTIAIDCGASFLKAACLDENGVILRAMNQKAPSVHQKESILETYQIEQLCLMVKNVFSTLVGDEEEIRLCISNEMHGFLLAYDTGKPFTDYISWQKEFGNIEIDKIRSIDQLKQNAVIAGRIVETGMPLRSGLPSVNLLYLTRAGILKKNQEPLVFYTLGDYIIRSLTGVEPNVHPTNAAATGLYSLITGCWDYEIIQTVTNNQIIFPPVGLDEVIGEYAGVKIHAMPAIGDQQAALLGAGFDRPCDLSFNLGTGAQVSRLSSSVDFSSDYQVRPYFDGYYIHTVPHIPSGRALNVFFRFIKSVLEAFGCDHEDDVIWNTIRNGINLSEDRYLDIDLGFFENAVNSSRKGAIREIEEDNFSLNILFSSIIHQLIKNDTKMADLIFSRHEDVKRLVFSGGVARRFPEIREGIAMTYTNALVKVAENETLTGLWKYSIGDTKIDCLQLD